MAFTPNIVGRSDDDILSSLGADIDQDDLPGGFAGLTPTSVLTLTQVNISVPLNAFLRPDRLCLGTAATVALCRVVDLKVGTISLNVGQQPANADAFRYDAIGTRLKAAVTASPSVPPTVVFSNGTGGTIVVDGSIFGPVQRA